MDGPPPMTLYRPAKKDLMSVVAETWWGAVVTLIFSVQAGTIEVNVMLIV